MLSIKSFMFTFFDLLFPQDVCINIFDTLNSSRIEMLVDNIIVERTHVTCIAPLPFKKKLVRDAILAMKYHGHKRATLLLSEILAPYLIEELAERRMYGSFNNPLIVPIPLHPARFKERGFNQAERIATLLLRYMNDKNITIATNFLYRIKKTGKQTLRASKQERYENIKNAFVVPHPEMVKNKDIILIDDVITTGATLAEAEKTLQKSGARNVLCVAVAH